MGHKFNPPPNWPQPPDGWTPPPGWQPDPSWGPVPEGWQLWIDDDGGQESSAPAPGAAGAEAAAEGSAAGSAAAGNGRPKRNWFIRHKILTGVGALVIVGMIGASLGGGPDDASVTADPTSTVTTAAQEDGSSGDKTKNDESKNPDKADEAKSEETAKEPTEEPAAEEKKPTTPEPEPVPKPVEYSGTGASVLEIKKPGGDDAAAMASFTHQGAANFAVWSLDSNLQQQDLLVNTIGGYEGTVLFDESAGTTNSLEIAADGPWTVTVMSVRSAETYDGSKTISGTGDSVFVYDGPTSSAKLTHNGPSNFAIWAYGDLPSLVVNEIGAYEGTVRWIGGQTIYEVAADGKWTVDVQ